MIVLCGIVNIYGFSRSWFHVFDDIEWIWPSLGREENPERYCVIR